MRAIVFREHSPSLDVYEYITDLPRPEPAVDEVLVQVHYAGLNRLDDFVRRGWKGLDLHWPHVPCADFSGTVVAAGAQVHDWAPGQQVVANPLSWCGVCRACRRGEQNRCVRGAILGEHVRGACAEYVAVPARNLVSVPQGYDMRKAAAAPLICVTAWHSLIVAGTLRAGERVLVVGAGGGVNSISIQIARLAGCEVYVVASNAKKAEQASALGADWVHDRSKDPNWSRAVYYATGKEGVQVVVDNVGKETWANSLRTLAPGGRLLTVGGTTGYDASIPINLIFGRQLRIVGSTMGTQDDFETVMKLVFAAEIEPTIDSIYPLAQFRRGIERMLVGKHFGKILFEVAHTD